MIVDLVGRLSAAASQTLIAMVRIYQACFRPLLPTVCRFCPSCSDYFIEAVQKHGPLKGAGLGAWRFIRCNPFSAGGYDPP